jgi:hypothetical protein
MEFREFLEECERREQMSLDEFNLLTVPKFAAGAASNFVTQSGRALGNVVAGGAKSALSAARVGLGGLQMLGGGREPGWDNVKKGWEGAEKAGLQIGRGALQAAGALSGATPLLRGAQAASEKITDVSGVYSPKGKGTLQDMFGMNNWGGSKGAEKPGESEARSKPTSRATAGQQKVASNSAGWEDSEEGQKLWQNLLAAYRGSAGKDKEQLHNTIRTKFPIKYADAMARKEAKKMMARVKK